MADDTKDAQRGKVSKKGDEDDAEKKKKEAELPPVSFFTLFRFATPFDLFLNFIGIVAAAGAGAAQPILALIFGSLALNFISFATTVKLFQMGQATADELASAARDFRHSTNRNALFYVYSGIGVLVCTWLYMYTWTYTSEVNSKRIREAYLRATLRQDVEYFDQVGAGEVATRIQNDTHLVQQGISEKVPMAMQFLGSFVAGMVIGYKTCWQLALAISAILPCIMISGGLMAKFMSRFTQLSTDQTAMAGSIAEESISTIRTAKAFGIQSHLGTLYNEKADKAGKSDLKLAVTQGLGLATFFFIIYAAYSLAFSFGTTLINQGHANAGQVITVFMSVFIGAFSLTVIAPEAVAITTARGAAAKLFDTIARTPTIDSSSTSGDKPSTINGTITLSNITFTYPSRPDVTVLHDVSMDFKAGKSYALVGPSGSGKSTIVNLIERFYDPQEGNITLDGADLKSLNVKWLRQKIGLVSQEPVLFGTTIRNNVSYGLASSPLSSTLSEEEKFKLIKEACIKANAHDFITRLPKGYDTVVGERGLMLSGGQKQRVAIARAIVSDPRVLLLDEATSALDTRSEEVVQDALAKAAQGRTTITIAHRLSTIKNADTIFVMASGRVLEHGSHDELMALNGTYARLVEAQGLKKQIGGMATPLGTDTPLRHSSSTDNVIVQKESKINDPRTDAFDKESIESVDIPITGDTGDSEKKSAKKEKKYSILQICFRMGALVKDQWLKFFFGTIFAVLVGLIYPAYGVIYSLSIDGFSQPDPHVRRIKGDRNALWFFLLAIAAGLTMGAQYYFFEHGAATLAMRLRKMCFKVVMRQDIAFFDNEKNTSGVLTARINGDPGKVKGLAGVTLATIVQSLATVIAGVLAGLIIVWKIGLVGLACMPILFSTGYSRLVVVILKDSRNKEAHSQSAQIACESAAAIRTVASLTREDECLEEYSSNLKHPLQMAIKFGVWSTLVYAASQASAFFVIALVFWFGSKLFADLEISIFQLFVGLMTTTLGALQAGAMFQLAPDLSAAVTAASDIITLLDSPSAIESDDSNVHQTPKETKDVRRIDGKLEAADVKFAYPTRPTAPVLRGINFTVEPGQYVAFVGASGSGKSTIIQLIQRFYDVSSGTILVDGYPLPTFDLACYRRDVALVSQEPLYSGSLKFNILLGATKSHDEVTQEELEEACRKANILDFVKELPDGFDTQVGNKGSQLSGGQKRKPLFKSYPDHIGLMEKSTERIAIARALIRNPKILLLDEATSALDTASEKLVQAALDEAAKGRTTIAIAHRLSTIQDADQIFFIKDGRVTESGTHNELLVLKGDYHDYVQLQTLQYES